MKKLDFWLLSFTIGVVTFTTACEEPTLEEMNSGVSSDTTSVGEEERVVNDSVSTKTGLLAYYPFNGNTNDESGNNHHATATGGEFATDRSGNTNKAFRLTSKSDALDIDDIANEQLSVSMWYYYEGTESFWNTLLYGNNSRHHLLVSHSDNHGSKGEIGTYAPGFQQSDYVLKEKQWYHIVLVKDGSQTKLYVDKTLVMETTDFSNADHPLTVIGNFDAGNGTQGALGKLDEIRIYGKVLTSNEVEYLFSK
ncbi:LamG domain-containing protein [Tunicatimonas pelagia]|uniref:LamG domain-containing protein n=1 Tax=Tunicatimonas pelagia TaxID=931531 RepID=UPI002665A87A|nr:LamG domain-containing protein [Tunicatimonas pelagia]WKN41052.1 LamG domain-containing protein [Tunicatimonas pelagia]